MLSESAGVVQQAVVYSKSTCIENCVFNGFASDFCLIFFIVEFGYDKANRPNTLAYASADIIVGCPISKESFVTRQKIQQQI